MRGKLPDGSWDWDKLEGSLWNFAGDRLIWMLHPEFPPMELVAEVVVRCAGGNSLDWVSPFASSLMAELRDFVMTHEPGLRLAAVELFLARNRQ